MMEQSPQSSKLLLLVAAVAIIAIITFVILTQSGLLGKKTSTNQTQTQAPATEDQPQAETVTVPAASSTPAVTIPMEEAQTQLRAIQDQVNAGTLSPEESKKQMEDLGTRVAPPELPAEAKK